MLTDDELLELLRGGESDRVEFTTDGESAGADDKIRRNVCAFANDLPGHGKPGAMFIGVNDDGSCANIPRTKILTEKLSELRLNAGIHPFPVVAVDEKTLNDCRMVTVIVEPSRSGPTSYNGDIWVRSGPTCRKATQEEEDALVERRSGMRKDTYDCVAVYPRAGVKELNIGLFHEYLSMAVSPDSLAENNRTDDARMRAMGFMTPDNAVTWGAILCFGKNPQKWLRGAYIQFLRCPGTEIVSAAEAIDHKQIDGTISRQIQVIESLMKVHIQTPAIIGGERRVDFPAYPYVALQQAIRNAVLHRSYEGTNAPIQCYWFNDRVEISSPGGPYGRVTVDNFASQEGMTDYRNPKLAEVMGKTQLIEKYGYGIGAIRRSMKRNGNSPPEFRVGETNVTVVLRKLDLDALVAKAAELACCNALFRFKRDWDSNSGSAFIRIHRISQLGNDLGFPAVTKSRSDVNTSAKDIAMEAVREYTKRKQVLLSLPCQLGSPLASPSSLIWMARIMWLLRELFGAEESEMRENLKESFICRTSSEERARKDNDKKFCRLTELRPALSEMESDIARESDDNRMRALIGD